MAVLEIMFYAAAIIAFLYTYKDVRHITVFSKKGIYQLRQRTKAYGKEITLKMQILYYVLITSVLLSCTVLFELNLISVFCILTMGLFLFPSLLLWNAVFYYRQKQFLDYVNYIQQFIVFFKNTGKIYSSLKACSKLSFGEFDEKITEAVLMLEEGKSFAESLHVIERVCPHFILYNLHSLIIAYEEYGAFDYEKGINLINEDAEDLMEDCFLFKQKQIEVKNKICILAFMALIVAWISKNMLAGIDDALNNDLYQCALSVFIMTLILTVIMAHRVYTEAWIDKEELF